MLPCIINDTFGVILYCVLPCMEFAMQLLLGLFCIVSLCTELCVGNFQEILDPPLVCTEFVCNRRFYCAGQGPGGATAPCPPPPLSTALIHASLVRGAGNKCFLRTRFRNLVISDRFHDFKADFLISW